MLTACAGSPAALARPVTVDPAPTVYPVPSLLGVSGATQRGEAEAPASTTAALVESLRADPANDRPRIVAALATVLVNGPTLPETDRARLTPALLDTLAAAAPGARGDDLRVPAIRALGAIRALDAAAAIAAILAQPQATTSIESARAAADALGDIADPRTADALVIAMLLDTGAQGIAASCLRALAHIGARRAVPVLIAALEGRNPEIARALASVTLAPGTVAPPEGFVQISVASALAAFASATAIDPLLALLADRAQPADARTAAAEALARTAVAVPTDRTRIVAAIIHVLDEPVSRDDRPWLAPPMASALAHTGDPSSIPAIVRALRNPLMAAAVHVRDRARLMHAYAILARHRDVTVFTPLAARLRAQLADLARRASGTESAAQPPISTVDRLQRIVAVARACSDGDLACYVRYLDETDVDVRAKAVLLASWTAVDARRPEVRDRLLARLEHSELSLRPALLNALESVAANDCGDCVARLEALIDSVPSATPPAPWQLDALFLAARLRDRGGNTASPPPTP